MKKVMLMGSLIVLSGSIGVDASDTALQLANGDTQLACVSGGGTGTMAVMLATENTRVPSYQYSDSFELSGENDENVIITLDKGYQVGGIFRRDSSIDKTYPCERTYLGLEKSESGDSYYAVYSLSANTEELGRLLLNEHYVDRNLPLTSETRFIIDYYDDYNLRTVGTLLTFVVDRDKIEREVSKVTDLQHYELLRTEKDGKYLDNPAGGDNVRIYVRPDGTLVLRDWAGRSLRELPPPPPLDGPIWDGPRIPRIPFDECTII